MELCKTCNTFGLNAANGVHPCYRLSINQNRQLSLDNPGANVLWVPADFGCIMWAAKKKICGNCAVWSSNFHAPYADYGMCGVKSKGNIEMMFTPETYVCADWKEKDE